MQELTCRQCGRPVRLGQANYETFEQMHYVCFHYQFEHDPPDGDTDEDCGVPGCPSASAARHKDRVAEVVRGLLADWSEGTPASWENQSVPDYLGALASWLDGAEVYYAQRGRNVPWNYAELMRDGLRAATRYE